MARTLFASLSLAALITVGPSALAADAEKGKAIHAKACVACHDSAVYTRPDRRIQSHEALEKRVKMCETASGKGLSEGDLSDIVAYLNTAFYKFAK